MKIYELLNEAVDPELKALVSKHKLKMNGAGTKIEDFKFTDEIQAEFKSVGYSLNWNGSKFDVNSIEKLNKKAEADHDAAQFAMHDVSGRKIGFKPPRKSGL